MCNRSGPGVCGDPSLATENAPPGVPEAPVLGPLVEDRGRTVAAGSDESEQRWNWHVQNTDIVQYHPRFHANYSGPNSMHNFNEVKETVSLDVMAAVRVGGGGAFAVEGGAREGGGGRCAAGGLGG